MPNAHEHRPSTADRVGLIAFIVAGVAIIAWSGYSALMRIMQLLLGEDVPFLVRFPETQIETPLGSSGEPIALQLDSALLAVRQMTAFGFWCAILEQLLFFIALATVIVCLLLLSRRALRGEILGRGSTALALTAGVTGLIGFGLSPVFGGLAGAKALLSVAGSELDGLVVFAIEPVHFIIGAFIAALVVHAFAAGARVQRDTEGLV